MTTQHSLEPRFSLPIEQRLPQVQEHARDLSRALAYVCDELYRVMPRVSGDISEDLQALTEIVELQIAKLREIQLLAGHRDSSTDATEAGSLVTVIQPDLNTRKAG